MNHPVMIGSRKIGATTKRMLGHSQKSVKILGASSKALNLLGVTNPFCLKK